MNIGSIVRRAVSAFGKSKTRGPGKVGSTGPRPTGTRSSPKADLAKSAARVAKKKL